MEYLHDYTDSRGNTYVLVRDDNNILAFLPADEYNARVHPVLSQRGVLRERKEGSGKMEYLYDYMDSGGNIYVVVQDDDNNILTLTADEYNERVHQENIRRTTP